MMRVAELNIKEIASLIFQGVQLMGETAQYWFSEMHTTAQGFFIDAFTLNVAGGIVDFKWEEGEEENFTRQREAKPVKKNKDMDDGLVEKESNSVNKTTEAVQSTVAKKFSFRRIFLRGLKRMLRFVFIAIPELFNRPASSGEQLDQHENRIRS